jgi:hypothetical protein
MGGVLLFLLFKDMQRYCPEQSHSLTLQAISHQSAFADYNCPLLLSPRHREIQAVAGA